MGIIICHKYTFMKNSNRVKIGDSDGDIQRCFTLLNPYLYRFQTECSS